MQGKTRERWDTLCARAADEQDPKRLLETFREIIHMFDEKAARLFKQWAKKQDGSKPN